MEQTDAEQLGEKIDNKLPFISLTETENLLQSIHNSLHALKMLENSEQLIFNRNTPTIIPKKQQFDEINLVKQNQEVKNQEKEVELNNHHELNYQIKRQYYNQGKEQIKKENQQIKETSLKKQRESNQNKKTITVNQTKLKQLKKLEEQLVIQVKIKPEIQSILVLYIGQKRNQEIVKIINQVSIIGAQSKRFEENQFFNYFDRTGLIRRLEEIKNAYYTNEQTKLFSIITLCLINKKHGIKNEHTMIHYLSILKRQLDNLLEMREKQIKVNIYERKEDKLTEYMIQLILYVLQCVAESHRDLLVKNDIVQCIYRFAIPFNSQFESVLKEKEINIIEQQQEQYPSSILTPTLNQQSNSYDTIQLIKCKQYEIIFTQSFVFRSLSEICWYRDDIKEQLLNQYQVIQLIYDYSLNPLIQTKLINISKDIDIEFKNQENKQECENNNNIINEINNQTQIDNEQNTKSQIYLGCVIQGGLLLLRSLIEYNSEAINRIKENNNLLKSIIYLFQLKNTEEQNKNVQELDQDNINNIQSEQNQIIKLDNSHQQKQQQQYNNTFYNNNSLIPSFSSIIQEIYCLIIKIIKSIVQEERISVLNWIVNEIDIIEILCNRLKFIGINKRRRKDKQIQINESIKEKYDSDEQEEKIQQNNKKQIENNNEQVRSEIENQKEEENIQLKEQEQKLDENQNESQKEDVENQDVIQMDNNQYQDKKEDITLNQKENKNVEDIIQKEEIELLEQDTEQNEIQDNLKEEQNNELIQIIEELIENQILNDENRQQIQNNKINIEKQNEYLNIGEQIEIKEKNIIQENKSDYEINKENNNKESFDIQLGKEKQNLDQEEIIIDYETNNENNNNKSFDIQLGKEKQNLDQDEENKEEFHISHQLLKEMDNQCNNDINEQQQIDTNNNKDVMNNENEQLKDDEKHNNLFYFEILIDENNNIENDHYEQNEQKLQQSKFYSQQQQQFDYLTYTSNYHYSTSNALHWTYCNDYQINTNSQLWDIEGNEDILRLTLETLRELILNVRRMNTDLKDKLDYTIEQKEIEQEKIRERERINNIKRERENQRAKELEKQTNAIERSSADRRLRSWMRNTHQQQQSSSNIQQQITQSQSSPIINHNYIQNPSLLSLQSNNMSQLSSFHISSVLDHSPSNKKQHSQSLSSPIKSNSSSSLLNQQIKPQIINESKETEIQQIIKDIEMSKLVYIDIGDRMEQDGIIEECDILIFLCDERLFSSQQSARELQQAMIIGEELGSLLKHRT